MDKVVHFEIPADKPDRARKFYQDLFGWKIEKAPGAMPYWMVSTVEVDKKTRMPKEAGAINGGIMPRQAPGESPVVVINVPSLDSTLKKVQKAGGRIVMPKMTVMDMGYYARVTDSEGNVIGIWETIPKKQ
ncbi:MAG: VOC family protein [Candidatus Aenigmarchaeota archaeon]|nr:VOC family protein [Candidatus Aenigmarchaeota archaeon]